MSSPLVRLYTKQGCHLCEQALADLERLRSRHPHQLKLVDIAGDAALMQRYGERIPVLSLNGREYAAPLTPELLERALADAATRPLAEADREAEYKAR